MKIMFLDVETGGLDEIENSLLSVGLFIWDKGNIIEGKEIFICKEQYNTVQAALDINKINLDELRIKGISEEKAIEEIESFCFKYFNKEKVILGGHNVTFDIGFIKALYRRNNKDFYSRFSYRFLDTGSILRFMHLQGKLENDIFSSDKAFEFFGITFEENKRHTALGDAEATAKLLSKLINK